MLYLSPPPIWAKIPIFEKTPASAPNDIPRPDLENLKD